MYSVANRSAGKRFPGLARTQVQKFKVSLELYIVYIYTTNYPKVARILIQTGSKKSS